MLDRFSVALATFFGIGRLPWAPGTWGSLAGLAISWFFFLDHPYRLLIAAALLFAVSVPACTRAEALMGEKDPSSVVVDEVVGMMVSMAFLPAPHGYFALIAFILFRLFDIWKPWPWKKLQYLPGGWGILVDDVGAGLYAVLFLQVGRIALSAVV